MVPTDPCQALSPAQAKRLDQIAIEQLGMSGLLLMENAGFRCAQQITNRFNDSRFIVLCGTGNNGGDGLVIARQLAVCGHPVEVWISGEAVGMSQECSANWRVLNQLNLPNLVFRDPHQLSDLRADSQSCSQTVIIDALLGISARGEPREPMAEAIRWANRQRAFRIAIDVPTGLDPESGQASENTFRAGLTLTIECPKTFATSPSATEFTGELVVIPLGIPAWVAKTAREKPD